MRTFILEWRRKQNSKPISFASLAFWVLKSAEDCAYCGSPQRLCGAFCHQNLRRYNREISPIAYPPTGSLLLFFLPSLCAGHRLHEKAALLESQLLGKRCRPFQRKSKTNGDSLMTRQDPYLGPGDRSNYKYFSRPRSSIRGWWIRSSIRGWWICKGWIL